MQLSSLNTCAVTMLKRLKQTETRSGPRQRVYPDSFTNDVGKVLNKLIGQDRRFVQIREPEELDLPYEITRIDSEEDQK